MALYLFADISRRLESSLIQVVPGGAWGSVNRFSQTAAVAIFTAIPPLFHQTPLVGRRPPPPAPEWTSVRGKGLKRSEEGLLQLVNRLRVDARYLAHSATVLRLCHTTGRIYLEMALALLIRTLELRHGHPSVGYVVQEQLVAGLTGNSRHLIVVERGIGGVCGGDGQHLCSTPLVVKILPVSQERI